MGKIVQIYMTIIKYHISSRLFKDNPAKKANLETSENIGESATPPPVGDSRNKGV